MQSLDNAVTAPLEAGRGPAPHHDDAAQTPAAADLLVLPPDLGHVLLRTARPEIDGASDGIMVRFDPAAVTGHAVRLLGAARARDPLLRRFLRPGLLAATDEPARKTIAELPLFLHAPGAPVQALWRREGWPRRDMTERHYLGVADLLAAAGDGEGAAGEARLPGGVRVTVVDPGKRVELRRE